MKSKIFTALFLAIFGFAFSQIQNAGFENEEGGLPANWKAKAVSGFDFKIDKVNLHSGKNSLEIIANSASEKVFFTMSQSIILDAKSLQKIRISVFIKSENADGNFGIWAQIRDRENKIVDFANLETQNQKVSANQNWTKYSLDFTIDSDSKKLVLGMLASGKGKVWFDDFEIQNVDFPNTPPSKIAENYIVELKNIIKKNSIFSSKIDWQKADAELAKISAGMNTVEETAPATQFLMKTLEKAGDHHSFIQSAETAKNEATGNTREAEPKSELLSGNIGYIMVPEFTTVNDNAGNIFAEKIQTMIQNLDKNDSLKGWIVDLRNNGGGNMYPMILGLEPLLGDGILGYFCRGNTKFPWKIKNGKNSKFSVKNPYFIKNKDAKVAVLLGRNTASSGEATAISFIGKNNVKTFGQPTAGYTSANQPFKLSDGKMILLAVSYEIDRNGKEYRDGITPDEIIDPKNSGDTALETAKIWIGK